MEAQETSGDDEVYALLGRLVVAVSNLEHEIDLAILSINDTHAAWLLGAARNPPMKIDEKAKIVADFVAEHRSKLAVELHADFVSLVINLFKLRNAILHGRLRGWEEPVKTTDSAVYITRLLIENRGGKKRMGLTTAVVPFSVLRDMTARAWHFAQMISQAIPSSSRQDVEMEELLESFRGRRGASNADERGSR